MYNLKYRPFNIRDADEVFKMTFEHNIGYLCGWSPHKSKEDTINHIEGFFKTIGCKGIIDKDLNKIVGCINILKREDNSVEIGYWIGKEYRNKGYITQAVKETIDYCFNKLNVDTIYCGYFEGNEASKRINEKCGFNYVKTVKVSLPIFNEIRNEIITKITKEDV